jgi:FkbH-like protein
MQHVTQPTFRNLSPEFRAPLDLAVTQTIVRRALVVGSCFAEGFSWSIGKIFPGAEADFLLFNNAGESPAPPRPVAEYDFQVTVLPLRTVMPQGLFAGLRWNDQQTFAERLLWSEETLRHMLEASHSLNAEHNLTTFTSNFLCPQSNSMGRLLPYNDPRNPAWYVRRLNDIVAEFCAARPNAYLLNADELASHIGRRHVQDDIVVINSHGAYIDDWDVRFDQDRLHPPKPLKEDLDLRIADFIDGLWAEVRAMVRSLRQQDSIKIVICDLDDTLWRGVLAEEAEIRPEVAEGWPLGVIEALSFLKRRGVLLAIASKNSEERIRDLWPSVIGNRLPLSSFATIKINWDSKAENVDAILREVNLLPRNALFIDDNPAERSLVQEAFPEIRTLGADLYSVRRILMWAPELQAGEITEESARRTEMVQSQIEREKTRTTMSREEFFESLNVRIEQFSIGSVRHPGFARAFELINKSNQFNTTGMRWSQEQVERYFEAGGSFEAFRVEDRFTDYGLVAVAILMTNRLEQFVMSCRVIGLDVELAAIGSLARTTLADYDEFAGNFAETQQNVICRDLYARCGFRFDGTIWRISTQSALPQADHVTFRNAAEEPVSG